MIKCAQYSNCCTINVQRQDPCDGAQTADGELLKIRLEEKKDHMLMLRTRRRLTHKTRRNLIEGKHVSVLMELDVDKRKCEI